MVNGEAVTGPVPVKHGDRIRFGNSVYFTFVDPAADTSLIPTFEGAATEASEAEMEATRGEAEKKLRAQEEAMKAKMQEEFEVARK